MGLDFGRKGRIGVLTAAAENNAGQFGRPRTMRALGGGGANEGAGNFPGAQYDRKRSTRPS